MFNCCQSIKIDGQYLPTLNLSWSKICYFGQGNPGCNHYNDQMKTASMVESSHYLWEMVSRRYMKTTIEEIQRASHSTSHILIKSKLIISVIPKRSYIGQANRTFSLKSQKCWWWDNTYRGSSTLCHTWNGNAYTVIIGDTRTNAFNNKYTIERSYRNKETRPISRLNQMTEIKFGPVRSLLFYKVVPQLSG